MNPDPLNWSGSPPCPFCSAKRTLPCENEQEYQREYAAWLPLVAGLAVLLVFFLLFLTAGSILRPLTVILLLAGLAYYLRQKESRRRKSLTSREFYCEECQRTFKAMRPGRKS